MSRLPLRTIEDAPAEAQPRLEAAQKNNGFLPNLVRLLANAPVALETYQTVGEINGRASLTLAEREAVQITAAAPGSRIWLNNNALAAKYSSKPAW